MPPWYAWGHMGTPCADTLKGLTVNPLTVRARHNAKREALENYAIAAFCGLCLGALCAMFV